MSSALGVGDAVQTRLGKGIVRELRRHGRVLVDVKGCALELDADVVSRLEPSSPPTRRASLHSAVPSGADEHRSPGVRDEVDLHGLTVDEALARVETAISDALLADRPHIRLIHGRSGGRIRGALHRRLRQIPSVRAFHLDPHNAGVTIVML